MYCPYVLTIYIMLSAIVKEYNPLVVEGGSLSMIDLPVMA